MGQMATFEQEIKSYKSKQLAAANLIEIISNLWINHGIELVLFRNQLIDRRGSLVLRLHQQTKTLMSSEIPIEETLAIAQCIQDMTLPLARIDIGTLALQARNKEPNDSLLFFVQKRLAPIIHHPSFSPKDVVLYGFGRIGRLLTREIINHTVGGSLLRLRAIVTRDRINSDSLQKRANLLLQDSIHGDFQGIVEVDSSNNSLIINGNRVYIISADKPQEIDYSIYGIQGALIID
ncbi:glyceraldehyde-3-phosphate dehydrogenase, partial [Sphingobacterium shayense]|uniref:glyceraldehyde 3-phosphate dehydrogenase NAD-binding domain-containing protein n=1 Tax=Sphingobacterium shayense TaxID=626343 RepID=UPI0024843AA6